MTGAACSRPPALIRLAEAQGMPESEAVALFAFTKRVREAHLCFFERADVTPSPQLFSLLSKEQQLRADRFKKSLRRNQHVWSRLMLLALAQSTASGGEAATVSIEERPPLAPWIHSAGQTFYTSVSHSGNRVACLISSEPCAIDIERFDPDRPFKRYAEVAFSKDVASVLAEEEDEARAFYCAWGAYECSVKLERPREFRWIDHAPVIGELKVQAEIQNGWACVTALSPVLESLKKTELSVAGIEGALLGAGVCGALRPEVSGPPVG